MNEMLYIDLTKGGNKGKREGLIQTVVTYVRNGKVITRKQWVRSEFAQHAKRNEDQKKEVMIRQAEKEKEKEKRRLEELMEVDDRKGERERRKMEKRQLDTMYGEKEDEKDDTLKEYHTKMKKMKLKEEKVRREEEDSRKVKKRKDEREDKGKDLGAFGQKEATKEGNRRELDIRG